MNGADSLDGYELAIARLKEERREWRKNHRWGYVAKPKPTRFGEGIDYLEWVCYIPGVPGTPWENGRYMLTLKFDFFHPKYPPSACFNFKIGHPNVDYTFGWINMHMLEGGWKPTYKVHDILYAINDLLDKPEMSYVVNPWAAVNYTYHKEEYNKSCEQFATASRLQAAEGFKYCVELPMSVPLP